MLPWKKVVAVESKMGNFEIFLCVVETKELVDGKNLRKEELEE